jgi:predicted Zn-dependent protease
MYKGEKLNNEADELYVIQAGGITAASGNATYNINFKKFIKQ